MAEKLLFEDGWDKDQSTEAPALAEAALPEKPNKASTKRGWVLDQLIIIGQTEAALGHIDERISDIWTDMENMEDDANSQKLIDELTNLYDLEKTLYDMRVEAENQVFDAFPDADRTKWCLVKHLSMAYAVACENFHARECNPDAEQVMLKAGEAVAKASAMAFGFEPFGCFRCLSEAMDKQNGTD